MIVIKLIIVTLFISASQCRLPDKVYCANEGCDKPISKAATLLNYNGPDENFVSFRGKSEAIVYMKSADNLSDLWYVNVEGRSGFVSSRFLREKKIIEKNPQFIISYVPKANENVQPDKVQQAHEVIEGTTIYTTEASVNAVLADVTTPPTINPSNEDLTPPLAATTENPVEDQNNNNDTDIYFDSQELNEIGDTKQESGQKSDVTFQESVNINSKSTELPEPPSGPANVETYSENLPEGSEQNVMNVSDTNEALSIGQDKKEFPNESPTETTAQQLLPTISHTENSVPLLDELKDNSKNTVNEALKTDTNKQNILLSSTDDNTVQTGEHNSQELNNVLTNKESVTDGPITQHDEDMPHALQDGSDNSNANDTQTNESSIQIPGQPSIPDQLLMSDQSSIPNERSLPDQSSKSEHSTEAEDVANPANTIDTTTSPETPGISESILSIPPVIVAIPSDLPPSTTTETIPALYPQETQTTPSSDTVAPIYMKEQEVEAQCNQHQDIPNIETTTSTPYIDHSKSEPLLTGDTYSHTTEETTSSNDLSTDEMSFTETPLPDQNSESIFSNIYSTVADIWPSTTETPPIYNTEDYPTHESEKKEDTEGFSFMKYFLQLYYSIMGTSEETKAIFASVGETCYTDEYCDGTSNDGTNRLLTFLLTTASSVLLFTLGYYYIDNRRQDGRLIGQINSLQRDLLFTTKECEILKEQLSSTKSKLAGIEDSSFGMDDMVLSLKEEIIELKATNDRLRNSLDDNEKLLRVSENTAGELQNTLSEVENTLSELLAERANSDEQIMELNGKIQAFEEELISVSRDRDNFQLKYVSAESALEELKKHKKQLEDVTQQLSESRNIIDLQKHEIIALKDVIKELKSGVPSNVDATSLIDHTEIKAKLAKALEEKKTFESKYEIEHKEKARLAEELQTTQETLHTTSQNATEALTRLDVLGKYFQERESELMKELNAKESLWLSKQGESTSTVEKIELLQQEVQRYKEKCDALTLELAEQESSRRAALSAVEAREHSAWLEARSARREADAARDEAAALRRKLASLSTNMPADGAISPHHKVASPLENIENPVIPPPLPPMFLPPPLLPPLPRPPPLGRLPSPHPPRYGDRRYSPESRYSPGSRYSPDSRYSPETVRYSPDSRYSPRSRRSAYSPRSRRRSRSRERYEEGRGSRSRNGPADTETEYNSDSPTREPRRRRYSRHSGPSSGSGCSSDSDK